MGDVYTNPPQSRNEAILNSIVEGTTYTDPPQSRIEDLLLQVKDVIEEGGHDESATRASIAPTESDSAHTSKNIGVGEQFYLSDDKLYTATSAISQGDAIIVYPTAGYNCKPSDSVTGQIADIESSIGWTNANLFNGFESGGINRTTGLDEESSTLSRSIGYVPVVAGEIYVFYGKENETNRSYRVFTYDSSKAYIESNGALLTISNKGYYKTPIGVSYIRLQCVNVAAYTGMQFKHISVLEDIKGKTDTTVIGNVEDGATASQAYSANDLFIRNGKIGKATTSIASGATLTLNTNYVETTIADLITTLLNA